MFYNFSQYKKLNVSYKCFITLLALFTMSSVSFAMNSKYIIVIGDSLSAGYGLKTEDGLSVQLSRALQKHYGDDIVIKVENAGVSGDTSSGGLARLEWVLAGKSPDLIVLEFGANDMLRGINPSITRTNIDKMLSILTAKKIKTLITGMKAAPNLGGEFTNEFDPIYPDLAKKYGTSLYPFLLKDVAGIASLNQNDAIHPNKKGVAIIIKNILPLVINSLDQ